MADDVLVARALALVHETRIRSTTPADETRTRPGRPCGARPPGCRDGARGRLRARESPRSARRRGARRCRRGHSSTGLRMPKTPGSSGDVRVDERPTAGRRRCASRAGAASRAPVHRPPAVPARTIAATRRQRTTQTSRIAAHPPARRASSRHHDGIADDVAAREDGRQRLAGDRRNRKRLADRLRHCATWAVERIAPDAIPSDCRRRRAARTAPGT